MRRALILALALLLLPSIAQALPWGYPPSQGVTLSDPTATSASPKTFRGVDQDTDVADEWYALGVSIMLPGATPTQVSAAAPLPVTIPAAFPAPIDLVRVGGVAVDVGAGAAAGGTQRTILASDDPAVALLTSILALVGTIDGDTGAILLRTPALGTAVMAGSSPVTIATDDTRSLAAESLLTGIDGILFNIDVATTSMDGHLPQLALGAQAPAAALSITQDSTGAWTVVEASAATIAGDTTSIDGHIPQLTLGSQAPAAALSVTQDSTGAWTVVEASGATIAGDTTSLDGKVPTLTLASQAPAASLSVVQDSTGAWTVVEASGAAIAGSVASLDGHVPQLTLAAQAPAASLSVVQDSTGAWTVVEASGATIAGHAATIAGDTTSIDGHIPQLTLAAQAPAASLSVVQDSTGAWTVVEASGATIAGDTTSLDTKIPTLSLASQAPAASLSVVQDSTGAWTVVEASGATIAGDTTAIRGQLPAALVGGALDTALSDGAGTPLTSTLTGADQGLDVHDAAAVTALQIMDDWDETNRAAVNVISGQAGAAADQGLATAATLRTVPAQADDNEDGNLNIDQTNAAACGVPYAIPADAYETTCQNQDDADYIRVRLVDAADTSTGFIIAPQGSGAGQTYTTRARGVNICFFNDTQDANAVVYCASETEAP